MKATITSKGQVTIPVEVRRRLNRKAGDVLDFDEKAPMVVARPDFDEAAMRASLGCLESRGMPPSGEWLEGTRGPVENPPKKP